MPNPMEINDTRKAILAAQAICSSWAVAKLPCTWWSRDRNRL